jgi:hypothetical protein
VLEGGISGWVTILLYCLWLNEHIQYSNKACSTIVYILNKCPHKILKDTKPEEAFTGEKPQVSHLIFLVVLCIFIFLMRRELNSNSFL